jgi:hypothetical protein
LIRQPVAQVAVLLIFTGGMGKCEKCFGFESRVEDYLALSVMTGDLVTGNLIGGDGLGLKIPGGITAGGGISAGIAMMSLAPGAMRSSSGGIFSPPYSFAFGTVLVIVTVLSPASTVDVAAKQNRAARIMDAVDLAVIANSLCSFCV